MIALLYRVLADVALASRLGAALAGEPDFGPTISCIAWRESRHELVGVHEGDRWMEKALGPGLSTRGVHGQVAYFALPPYLHSVPWLLDVPLFSAVIATRRAKHWRCRAVRACTQWMRCKP